MLHQAFRLSVSVAILLMLEPSIALSETQPRLTTHQWREDLHYLAGQIVALHPGAFHAVTKSTFDATAAEIGQEIPTLTEHEVEVEFIRLVAMLGEGHSRVSLPGLADPMSDVDDVTPFKDARLAFHQLPLKLYQFSDGIFVIAAKPEFRTLIGAKVTQIGGRPVSDAIEAVSPLINRDNEMGMRLLAPDFLTVSEILHAEKLAANVEPVKLELTLPDSEKREENFLPLAPGIEPKWDGLAAPPLYLRRRNENFWFDYIADTRTQFVKINVIQDSDTETFAHFAASVIETARSHPVDRIVLDLRGCHGGDNQKFRSLLLAIVRNTDLDRLGRLFVVTDRETFSAAANAVSDFERLANVIFVGEPPAGSPNSWGDPKKIILPNSGLVARISTVYWRDWTNDETRPFVAPDVPVALSSADYFAARDPSLEAISRFTSETDFADILNDLVRAGAGMKSVLRFYYQHKTDPARVHDSTEAAMLRVGTEFLARRSYKDALLAFEINVQDYPGSLVEVLGAVRTAERSRPEDAELKSIAATLEHFSTAQSENAR